jgi:hypothetical protein
MESMNQFAELARRDLEMRRWLMAQILLPNYYYLYVDSDEKYNTVQFLGFDTTYYGRLGNPGTKPGKYWDHSKARVRYPGDKDSPGRPPSKEEQVQIIPIEDLMFSCALGNTNYEDAIDALPNTWHLIDLSKYFIEDLPDTKFMESDVVRLIDDHHPNYTGDLSKDQYTIYRVHYNTAPETQYRLRAGGTLFDANENQLAHAADGPVRILNTQEHPLAWRSLKDEAEFQLLVGRYRRVFNQHTYSYKWNLNQPEQKETLLEMLSFGVADGILDRKDHSEVVIFDDREVGRQVAGAPDLVLDI